MDAKFIEDLKAKHPGTELHKLGGTDELVIVKCPPGPIWDAMQDKVLDSNSTVAQKRAAAHNLVISCVVHPSREQLAELFEKKPGLLQTFMGQLSEIAGVNNQAKSEKL
jgi:hypothetical protein